MISSIEISGFRGIREGKLEDLTPLVILVGPNGCGKSTVLEAALIGCDSGEVSGTAKVTERHAHFSVGARWLFFRAHVRGGASVAVTTPAGFKRLCRLTLGPEGLECQEAIVSRFLAHREVVQHPDPPSASGAGGGEVVPEACLVEPGFMGKELPPYRLFSQAIEQGRRDQVRAIIGAVVPGLDDMAILAEVDAPVLHLLFKDGSLPTTIAGDGVFSLVQLCLALASRRGGVVLLEEPEVHQHPGAIRQSVRAILAAVRREIQVILSTHSLELIDILLAESTPEDLEKLSVCRLQLREGVLASRRIPGKEASFLRNEIENDLR